MALRFWSGEVSEARELIQTVLKRVDPDAEIVVDGGEGFDRDTFAVLIAKADRQAIAVVSVEACMNARTDAAEMEQAFRDILAELESDAGPQSRFLVTTKGLTRKPLDTHQQLLEDSAALIESEEVKWPR